MNGLLAPEWLTASLSIGTLKDILRFELVPAVDRCDSLDWFRFVADEIFRIDPEWFLVVPEFSSDDARVSFMELSNCAEVVRIASVVCANEDPRIRRSVLSSLLVCKFTPWSHVVVLRSFVDSFLVEDSAEAALAQLLKWRVEGGCGWVQVSDLLIQRSSEFQEEMLARIEILLEVAGEPDEIIRNEIRTLRESSESQEVKTQAALALEYLDPL
jgi:hypothetical protein